MEAKLSKIYYDPEHLWVGRKAIRLLQKESGESKKVVTQWLYKQALFQVHTPPPKHIDHPHYYVTKVNQIHQADLLFLPHDKVYQNTYKYALTLVDIASRYKAVRPLRTKKASEVASLLADIYKKGPLKYPSELHVDSGTEFKADVLKLMKNNNVKVVSAVTKYHHSFTAFIERFNQTLAIKLFKPMDAQELQNPAKDSKIWVKNLYKTVQNLNNQKAEVIGTTPAKAVRLDKVTLKMKPYPNEKIWPEDGLYRYLLRPGEEHGDQKRRATDVIWSRKPYRFDRIIEKPGRRVLYYLAEGPKRAFVREELLEISENTELPPDFVKNW